MHKTMKKNREPQNKPTHIRPIGLQQRRQEYTMGKRQSLQYIVLGKLDSHMQKNEIRLLPYTMHKN